MKNNLGKPSWFPLQMRALHIYIHLYSKYFVCCVVVSLYRPRYFLSDSSLVLPLLPFHPYLSCHSHAIPVSQPEWHSSRGDVMWDFSIVGATLPSIVNNFPWDHLTVVHSALPSFESQHSLHCDAEEAVCQSWHNHHPYPKATRRPSTSA